MKIVIIRYVDNLQDSTSYWVNKWNFKLLETQGSSGIVSLIPPEGNGKIIFRLKECLCHKLCAEGSNSHFNQTMIEFMAESQEEFEMNLIHFESLGMIDDFQDYLSYSELGHASIIGPDNERFSFSKPE